MASSAPSTPLRQLFEDRLSQLSTEVEAMFGDARERARRDLAEHLNGAARRMRQAADAEELASTLVDSASGAFAAGAAFFRVQDRFAQGERIRGVPEENAGRFAGTRIALDRAAALAGAVESRDPVTAVATASEVSEEMLEIAAPAKDQRVSIFPIVVRDAIRALLYTWGDVQVAATELLCQVAAAVWAGMEPVEVKAPAPALVRIEGARERARPTWESLPAEQQQVHLKAQRFARVQVAEMRLQEGQAVQAGRARRDLYGALRSPIDAARTRFRETFFAACPSMVDYLHLELVRTLANDDADLLGKNYPGPLL